MALVVTFAISAVLSPRWSAAHQVESSAEKKRERGPGDERRAFEAALATELEFEWAKAIVAEVERDTSERPRPGWVIPTLRLYLTLPYAEERPKRTGYLWTVDKTKSPLWGSQLGDELIENLLSDDAIDLVTADRTRDVLSRLVSEEDAHERYVERLRITESPSFYVRAFPVLADYRPNLLVGEAIQRYVTPGELPVAAIQASLANYLAPLALGYTTVEQWTSFWDSNRQRPIGRLLTEAIADLEAQRRLEIWQSAAKTMEGTDAVRTWLIEGLAADRLISIRVDAMRQIRNYALKRRSVSAIGDDEARKKELGPLLRGSLQLARDRNERSSLRELAIDAIGEMVDFKSDPGVLALLKTTLEELADAPAGSAPHSLGLAAIRVVGALGANLALELDEVLEIELAKANEGWAQLDRDVVVQILEALRNVELSPTTLPHLLTIFELTDEDSTKDLVLQIFLRIDLEKFPDDGKQLILAFYRQLVETNRPSDYIAKAIAGIDYLRLEDGIAVLEDLASDEQVKEADRIQAVESIAAIGGTSALRAFATLLEKSVDPVRARVLQLAIAECSEDPEKSLEATEGFLIADRSQRPPKPAPWFLEAVQHPSIEGLLLKEPDFWVFSSEGSPPADFFRRWWTIEWAVLVGMYAAASRQESSEEQTKGYLAVERRARRDLAAVKGDAGDFPLDEFNGFLARSKRRIDVLAGLASGDFAMCESAIAKLADSSRSYDETVAWLLTRLPRFDVREGDAEFLTNVKKIGTEKGYSLEEATAEILDDMKIARKLDQGPGKKSGDGNRSRSPSRRLEAVGKRN